MSLTTRSRRADAFAEMLDSGRRTDDPTVAPFVALAEALRSVPAPAGPSPEFADRLRGRLVAVATVQGAGTQAAAGERLRELGGTWRFQRRMAAIAGAAAVTTAIAGVGLGASRSLPGDPFYGVKRASEQVQLATTFGAEAKGERHLEFARTRLGEVKSLAAKPAALGVAVPGASTALGSVPNSQQTDLIISTLADMNDETRAGAADLLGVYRSSGSVAPLTTLNDFTQEQFTDLRALAPTLPIAAQPDVRTSLRLLDDYARQTVALAHTAIQHARQNGSIGGRQTPGGHSTHPTRPTGSKSPTQSQSPSSTPTAGGSHSAYPTAPPTLPPLINEVTTSVTDPSPSPMPTSVPTGVPTVLPTDLPRLPGLPSIGLG
jgi:hypothetical protein